MKTFADTPLRMGAILAAAGLVVLATGGCGGTAGSENPVKTPAAAAQDPKVLTGGELNAMLLSADAMPKGFKINADGTRDSGDVLAEGSTSTVPRDKLCGILLQTAWIRAAGIDGAAFAQNDYLGPGRAGQFAQEIDTFQGDNAEKVMAALKKAFGQCASFIDKSDGTTAQVKLVRSAVPGVGDEAIKAVQTSPAWQGGTTLVAARVGNAVVTTLYSSSGKDKGAAGVKMTKAIVENVQAAQ
ncbi:hypothetical protein GCM10023194_05070 [Planotetraspora phitsanulokensis]|uniref:PknH-like extracellular domain-containing protein n=1 Tax=Planotetraspora phitsanulokensis TaxID=575192 RepID=A0A8J3XEP8_9ACTN|nr:hypothetical protein [Planotetraspora phitsanulokensis]GII38737.1 hypothetical protein Pph01_37400 [Planotetraspora phitsanulokensis]